MQDRDCRSCHQRCARKRELRSSAQLLSLTYAKTSKTQVLPNWIIRRVRLFRFLRGVPDLIMLDNIKREVHKISFYGSETNRSDGLIANYDRIKVRPARLRDKAKLKAGIRFAQSYILGRLRWQTFSFMRSRLGRRRGHDSALRPRREGGCRSVRGGDGGCTSRPIPRWCTRRPRNGSIPALAERPWHVRRSGVPITTGQHRWDRAY